MPQPRRLTDEQEAAALALYRAGLPIAEIARTYNLTWYGMKGCLDRAQGRETAVVVSRETTIPGRAP